MMKKEKYQSHISSAVAKVFRSASAVAFGYGVPNPASLFVLPPSLLKLWWTRRRTGLRTGISDLKMDSVHMCTGALKFPDP
jgi:hypothetical protein